MSRVSKFLSLVLRHDPARIGITLDDAGWTDVSALLAALAAHGTRLTRDELHEIVRTSDKQRFAVSSDGTRIRANQGHSVPVELGLPAVTPPETLFHGTVEAALPGIEDKGLIRGARHAVHLSADVETASTVGARRGKPVILSIRAGAMGDAGFTFQRSENGVWLTDRVPAEYIIFTKPRRSDDASRGRAGIAKQTLAACQAGCYANGKGEIVDIAALVDRAQRGTVLHELGVSRLEAPARSSGRTRISVTAESTLEALVRLDGGGSREDTDLACLNFASAKNPGGGFLSGAQAQEESLARSSALYPCLLAQPEHYRRNRAYGSCLYLDLAVFSPAVPVFRDDRGGWLDRPVLSSVITCAAPNVSGLRQQGQHRTAPIEATLRRRAEFVLAIAAHHGVRTLVLGAWGAGVFANDPVMVADAFHRPLVDGAYAQVFDEVVFAIVGGPERPNHDAFATRFISRSS
jgi:uncharacterized protein (TIGR02452 family)